MVTPVNNIELKTTVEQSGKDNLLYQFHNSENLKSLVGVFLKELQEVENEVYKLMTLRTLENATGDQLDEIGAVLNVPRTSSDDEIYRSILKIRNARQTATGNVESALTLLRLFTGDEDVSIYKGDVYTVDVYFNDTCNPDARVVDNLKQFFPVVTSLRGVSSSDGVMFGFDGDDSAGGFGSIHDQTAGAGFGSLIV